MKITILLLASLTLAYGCKQDSLSAAATAEKIQVKKSAIVGGNEVDPKKTDTSFIVNIDGSCAGSIISSKWILTAAHCRSLFKGARVTAGSISLESKRIRLKVKNSYVHPDYKAASSSNDIALLELAEEIDFDMTKLSAIEIAPSEFEKAGGLEEGMMATVLGWGLTSERGRPSTIMRELDVPLVSRDKANAFDSYKGRVDESMIAAGYEEGGRDSCQGDSGGPLVMKNKADGTQTLIGVVSFGDGCARVKKYGIYSSVAYANEWIHSVIDQ